MILRLNHGIKLFSTQRFFKLVENQNIPQYPQDLILTKYLKQQKVIQTNNPIKNLIKPKQQKFSKLEKISYSKYINGNPYGSIKRSNYKGCQLTLLSTNYNRVSPLTLLESVVKSQADIVIVQCYPQAYSNNYQILPKNLENTFSDVKYLNQLKGIPSNIISNQTYQYLNRILKQRRTKKNINLPKQIISKLGVISAAYYSLKYNKQFYFCEIPQQINREWIVNSNTLFELKQIFNNTCKMLPRYQQLQLTPIKLANLLYPDIFLSKNDHYMATIIEMLIAKYQNINILGIFGIVQNQAVMQCLQKKISTNPIIQLLIPKNPKSSIVRNLTFWQIVQKHIILDLMKYGNNIINMPFSKFKITNNIINFYSPKDVDSQKLLEIILKFQYDKIQQYLTILEEKYKEGKQQIKKQFVRQALRQKMNQQ